MLEFSIISISAFVSVLNELTKTIANNCFKKSINRYIPIFSLVYGVALAITGYYIPDVYFGNNIVEAIFIGLAAGGAAVGVHQTFHQLSKPSENVQHTLDEILSQEPEDASVDEESSDENETTVTVEEECEEPSDIESNIEESSDNTDEDVDED
jgi:hypothetical protein